MDLVLYDAYFASMQWSVSSIPRARMAGYLASDAFAGPYLADQLLLPFAIAGGGSFPTMKPSQHGLTAAALNERLLKKRCVFTQQPLGTQLVEVRQLLVLS